MERTKTTQDKLDELLSRPTPESVGECMVLIEEFFELKLDRRIHEYQAYKTRLNQLILTCNQLARRPVYKFLP